MLKNIVWDVDGVILDSNRIKEENIRKAAAHFSSGDKLDAFVDYFISHNGVPREVKIEAHFGEGTENSAQLLELYNSLNSSALMNAPITAGIKACLDALKTADIPLYAASGGLEPEVKAVLTEKRLAHYFKDIKGGPMDKKSNVESFNLEGPSLLVGDSKHDYEVAKALDMSFIFISGYTQFNDWKSFFEKDTSVQIFKTPAEFAESNTFNLILK